MPVTTIARAATTAAITTNKQTNVFREFSPPFILVLMILISLARGIGNRAVILEPTKFELRVCVCSTRKPILLARKRRLKNDVDSSSTSSSTLLRNDDQANNLFVSFLVSDVNLMRTSDLFCSNFTTT